MVNPTRVETLVQRSLTARLGRRQGIDINRKCLPSNKHRSAVW